MLNVVFPIMRKIFRLFNQAFGIKANVWAAKYHEAGDDRKMWKVLVPKEVQKVRI